MAGFHQSYKWKKLRKKIKNRDKHCLVCGRTNDLEVHHIIPLNVIPCLKNDEMNVITLCKFHHGQAHNGMLSCSYLLELLKEVTEMIGKKFGKLTVIEQLNTRDKHGYPIYKCVCDCGNVVHVNSNKLKTHNTKSCGCLKFERLRTHGHSHDRLYTIYNNLKNRCCNKNHRDFKDYGGRGIAVCDEWCNDFMNFYKWSIANGYNDTLTIDRIDVNGNYEPSNCRWTNSTTQSRNKRNTVYLTYNGVTKSLPQWAEELGVKYNKLYSRYRRKWTTKEILLGRS